VSHFVSNLKTHKFTLLNYSTIRARLDSLLLYSLIRLPAGRQARIRAERIYTKQGIHAKSRQIKNKKLSLCRANFSARGGSAVSEKILI